jgi:hypothetical protein
MDDVYIRSVTGIINVMAYNNAHHQPTWCIHTPPTSTIGGFSCKLIGAPRGTQGMWEIELNNGDRKVVPMSEIHLSGRI